MKIILVKYDGCILHLVHMKLCPWAARSLCALVPSQRDLTKSYADVYVFSGPLYMPARASNGKWIVQYEMLGDDKGGHVAVPTHFFKVIMAEERGRIAIGAFIMPNKPIAPDIPLEKFTVELATVESASGLHFFERLRAAGSIGGVLQKGLCSDTTCVLPPGYHEAKARAKL